MAVVGSYADTTTALVFCTVLVGSVWAWRRLKPPRRNLPPGPTPWPVLGNLPKLLGNDDVAAVYAGLAERYGDVFSLYLGSRLVVVVCGNANVREALVEKGDHFSGRAPVPKWAEWTGRGRGVLGSSGAEWRELRRFTLRALRDFGVGKASLESTIQDEISYVGEELARADGGTLNLSELFGSAISNIICSVIFGSRFEYDDPEFKTLLLNMNRLVQSQGPKNSARFVPWLKYFSKRARDTNEQTIATLKSILAFVRGKIGEHQDSFDPENVRDFIDLYLKAKRDEEEGSSVLTDESIMQVIVDLFLAGSETTSTTLLWAFLFMIRYPDVQERCRAEILATVGQGRPVTFSERARLPYTMATLLEIQRLGNTAPMAVPHYTTADTSLNGYFIPEGTVIHANLQSAHMDPAYWESPRDFRPARWLDENNDVISHSHFMPFSVGRRVCLGEQLARMELFLYFVSLLQRFRFDVVDPGKPPVIRGIQGITHKPLDYHVRVSKMV